MKNFQGQAIHLAEQSSPKYLPHHNTPRIHNNGSNRPIVAAIALLNELEASVVASINGIEKDLVRVLLPALPEVLGEQGDALMDLGRRIHNQRPMCLLDHPPRNHIGIQVATAPQPVMSAPRRKAISGPVLAGLATVGASASSSSSVGGGGRCWRW
ncbi:uncharacterized protein A4U43_UnF8080 [Asparagus officinalis]|uniref:Uncharacterized protein n=1 Tax=Asparagus officinalis TaxID=4686 RepID=A0A1R3L620_ASPOF|nr:uncharacterized protein A4U43_UnF8080 [Asparagus officinalis]